MNLQQAFPYQEMITDRVVLPGASPAISKLFESMRLRGMDSNLSRMLLCEIAVLELSNQARMATRCPTKEEVGRYYINTGPRNNDSPMLLTG